MSSQSSNEFMSIFLRPNVSSELYGAWDHEFWSASELVVDGVKKDATISSWITELPDCLLFSVQSVSHQKDGKAIKNQKRFDFETTIYADRYMLKNKEQSIQVSGEVKGLRE